MKQEPTYSYDGHLGTVPVGEKFERVSLLDPEGGPIETVEANHVVSFDDPDIDHRDADRGVHSRLFVGFADAVLKPNFTDEPQLFTTMPIGRIDAFSPYVNEKSAEKFRQRLLKRRHDGDDPSDYLTVEWGEDIDGSGDDAKFTWG